MTSRRTLLGLSIAATLAVAAGPLASGAHAQGTIKIGELNSYKSQPAFLDPYKKGWELAVEEINAAGGIKGRKLEVISRDDNANPGDAVRVAEELVTREGVTVIATSSSGEKLARAKALGAIIVAGTPAEYAQFLRKDHERWGRVIKAAGVKAE